MNSKDLGADLPRRRAEVLAGFFLAGYLGLSIPVVGLGILGQVIAPKVALLAFALLVLAGIAASARSLPRGARTGTPGPSPQQWATAIAQGRW
jgi:hypothetical protein